MGKSCGGTRCSGPGCARKMEVDGEKLWRHQVFGARMREKNGRKLFF